MMLLFMLYQGDFSALRVGRVGSSARSLSLLHFLVTRPPDSPLQSPAAAEGCSDGQDSCTTV